jgi:outer membrane protein OmpA-like peptidoglycan-associated protein/tetratricopeptide (TPR) repeat protein
LLGWLAVAGSLGPLAATAQTDTTARPQTEAREPSYNDLMMQARRAYSNGELAEAVIYLNRARRQRPNTFEVNFLLGLTYHGQEQHRKALKPLKKAYAADSNRSANLRFYLAQAHFYHLHYSEAKQLYESFLDSKGKQPALAEQARLNLRKAIYAEEAVSDSIRFEPVNLGQAVNSPGEDYNAFLTADEQTLYFNSHREGNLGGFQEDVSYNYSSDFYRSKKSAGGRWQTAEHLSKPLNSLAHEKEFWLSPSGERLLFGRHPLRPGKGRYDCDIYQSYREGSRWTQPQQLAGGNGLDSPFCDSWPSLSGDGHTLYFISNRPGGEGGFDIWKTEKQADGRWGEPENLGPKLNTPGDEFDVFIHPDGQTLYFSSDWHEGFGGFDIYVCRRKPYGWSEPENLGYPLNTPYDEFDFFVDADGTTGYINSDRYGGYGLQDLYRFPLDSTIRPTGTAVVSGQVTDSTDQPLDAQLTIVESRSGDTVRQTQTDPRDGSFVVNLPRGRDYNAYIEAAKHLFKSKHFTVRKRGEAGGAGEAGDRDTDAEAGPERTADGGADGEDGAAGETYAGGPGESLTVRMAPMEPGARTELNNIFFDFDKATLREQSRVELDVLTELLKRKAELEIRLEGHTDNVGTKAYNMDLSRRRAQAVRDYLVAHGIDADRIRTRGYGERKPIATNETPHGRQQNRRTELIIIKTE